MNAPTPDRMAPHDELDGALAWAKSGGALSVEHGRLLVAEVERLRKIEEVAWLFDDVVAMLADARRENYRKWREALGERS